MSDNEAAAPTKAKRGRGRPPAKGGDAKTTVKEAKKRAASADKDVKKSGDAPPAKKSPQAKKGRGRPAKAGAGKAASGSSSRGKGRPRAAAKKASSAEEDDDEEEAEDEEDEN